MSKKGTGDISNINKLIHSPARLSIMTYLYVIESGDAVYLANQTKLTWGNLSSHLSKLEDAGYVEITKTFEGKKPKTMISLTQMGREAFDDYRKNMNDFLSAFDD